MMTRTTISVFLPRHRNDQKHPGELLPPKLSTSRSYQATRTREARMAPILKIGGKQIDLYSLHTEVSHFGGVANVRCPFYLKFARVAVSNDGLICR